MQAVIAPAKTRCWPALAIRIKDAPECESTSTDCARSCDLCRLTTSNHDSKASSITAPASFFAMPPDQLPKS
ncbi:hypothetical protein MRB53_038205 [Persea americana]|nr:hypothetical protein MRB53_038205 [Persea americana]